MRRFADLYSALDASSGTQARVDALVAYFSGVDAADGAWALHIAGRPAKDPDHPPKLPQPMPVRKVQTKASHPRLLVRADRRKTSGMNPIERDTRIALAACYRLIARYGMTDLIFNHITARFHHLSTAITVQMM